MTPRAGWSLFLLRNLVSYSKQLSDFKTGAFHVRIDRVKLEASM